MSNKTRRMPYRLAAERDNEDLKSHEMFTGGRAHDRPALEYRNELANLYHSLAVQHYSSSPTAMAVFFAQSWFEGKVLLVDLLMRIEAPKEFFDRWEKIIKELKQHRVVRNLVAHQRLYVSFPNKEGRVNVWLDPAELNWEVRSQEKEASSGKGAPTTLGRSAVNGECVGSNTRSSRAFGSTSTSMICQNI